EMLNGNSGIWEDRLAAVSEKQQILLRPSDQALILKVALLDYLSPAGHRFSYHIEGLDIRETQLEGNTVRLDGLPYGRFRLVIEARPASGFGTFSTLSIPLMVAAPFWRTWWFLAVVLAALAVLTFALIRLRTRQLRKQKARLEQEVAVRTAEILIQNQWLEDVNATKDRLFSIISHELKDHVISFLGIAQKVNYLLKKNQPERLLQLGDHIEQSARNLEGLLSNLLHWALSQRNGMISSPEPVSLKKLTEETLAVFQSTAGLKGVRFETCVPAEAVVFADKIALATVLRNLVANAIKFSPQDGLVHVWADQTEPGSVELTVQDYGIGIPADKLEKLFAIYQNKSTFGTAGERGSGLGLALCQSLVGMNNGTIHVKSEVGKGTRVRVNLPATEMEERDLKMDIGKLEIEKLSA
ncbi:MAG: HAMP domain-containing sensor histidine kinase, partial [Bacteroidota bacterium]